MGLLEKYIIELRLNGAKDNTVRNTEPILRKLDKYKGLETCTKDDIRDFLSHLQQTGIENNTLAAYKTRIKQFFLWYKKPEVVDWIKIKKDRKTLNEKDLLTGEEIRGLLASANHPRDKALISLLTETAGRATEILNLDIQDITFTDYGAEVRILAKKGNKTGPRDIPVIDSVQYIKSWLNQYPSPLPDKPLFTSFNRTNQYERLGYAGALAQIKRIAKRAGIQKRIHLHLFRHTQLTNMVRQGYQESLIRMKAGWSRDSSMIAVYLHPGKQDLVNATLAKNGKSQTPSISPNIKLTNLKLTKECPDCHREMPIDAQFCENCSKHQDLSPVVKRLGAEVGALRDLVNEEFTTNQELKEEMKILKEQLTLVLEELHS